MNKRAFELSVSFLVILIICIATLSFSIYIVRKFFTHAENLRMTYDERTEREIEQLLDDGSRIAIPFDKKEIGNGEFKTFGIGILNTLNIGMENKFRITVGFNKAYDKKNVLICSISDQRKPPSVCGEPNSWLKTSTGTNSSSGVLIQKTVKNNEQEKFLIGMQVKNALAGTYIFDLNVQYETPPTYTPYDTTHKLYVDVP